MTDKNKTIQEALAEVQRNAELRKVEEAKTVWGDSLQIDEASFRGGRMPKGPSRGPRTVEPEVMPKGSTAGETAKPVGGEKAKEAPISSTDVKKPNLTAPRPTNWSDVAGTAAIGALAAGAANKLANDAKDKPMSSVSPAPTSGGISPAPAASKGRTGVGINKVMNRGKETPAEPLKMAKVEPKTFGQAFSAAREKAKELGKTSTGQFEYKGKQYQTNIKGEKYVTPPKQTGVSVTKEVPLPPKRPADLGKPMSGISPAPATPTGRPDMPHKGSEWKSGMEPIATPGGPSSTTTTPKTDTFTKTDKPFGPPTERFAKNTSDGVSRPTDAPGKISNAPLDTSKSSTSKLTNLEYESGGKKKKMSEEMNPLVAAFLKLQETNPSNMFEAAKKAKKDYDKDGKIESPKDEVWGSRFRAAKAAGKMEEATLKDPKDPSVQGSGDVTSTPAAPVHVKPTNPEKLKNLKDPRDSSVQGSGDVTYKEEVEELFSAAELEHLNRFFNEASVAPSRPEVARGADSVSDKMSQNDVTGTSTEGGKKKVKEEVELDEKLTDEAKANIRTALSDKMKKTSGPARSLIKLAKMNPANVKEETLEEGRPKKNPTPETTERDPRKHIQVEAGRAAAGNVIDFPHNDGTKSKITPAMGRRIVAHLQGLKPADRQAAVNKMHDSAEGLKV